MLVSIPKSLLQHTLQIGILQGQQTNFGLELVASLATGTLQRCNRLLVLGGLLLHSEHILSEVAEGGHHIAGAFDLEVHHGVLALETVVDFSQAGEGVPGADELTVPVLGEDDEIREATGHDGLVVVDVGLSQRVVSM